VASGAVAARVAEWQFFLIPLSLMSLALGDRDERDAAHRAEEGGEDENAVGSFDLRQDGGHAKRMSLSRAQRTTRLGAAIGHHGDGPPAPQRGRPAARRHMASAVW
jgi:hypothetical protein